MRIDYMNQCPTILREYFGYMETIKGKSEKTVEGYFIDLRSFFRYLKLSRGLVSNLSSEEFEKIPIDDVTLEMIESVSLTEIFEYMNYLKMVRATTITPDRANVHHCVPSTNISTRSQAESRPIPWKSLAIRSFQNACRSIWIWGKALTFCKA